MSRNSSNEPSRRIAASIGCAIPKDPVKSFGYLSEHHSYGETEDCAGKYAERLAENMLFTWTKAKPGKTMNISKTAEVDDEGNWTTVISAAVFII